MKKAILTLAFLLFATNSWAVTYYVNATGGDDARTTVQAQNSGTPWLTIQKCADNAAAGDTCSVAFGTYAEKPTFSTAGGTGNAGTGLCDTYITVTGNSKVATTHGFRISGACVEVKEFNMVSGSGNDTCVSATCRNGISIGASYVKVTNNYISGWRGQAAIGMDKNNDANLVWATRDSWAWITNNSIYNSQHGILIWGDNVIVSGNEVNRLRYWVGNAVDETDDTDYLRAWGIGINITSNFFHGTVWSEIENPNRAGFHGHVDCMQSWSYHSGYLQNVTYNRNWCSEFHQITIQNAVHTNINITNSVFANAFETDDGVLAGGLDLTVTGSTQTGNTWYNVGAAAGCAPTATGCLVRNNIVFLTYDAGTQYCWQYWAGSDDHNLCFCDQGTFGVDKYSVNPWPATDVVNANPLFVSTANLLGADGLPFTSDDGLRLQAGSPAKGAASDGSNMGAYRDLAYLSIGTGAAMTLGSGAALTIQ